MAVATARMSLDELMRRLEGVQEPLKSIAIQIYHDSGGRIGVTGHGGFRDRAQQERMYQDYLNGGNLAAKPGHSMHERGLAVDFDTDDYDLLASIASKYGLVNSVDGEPWHYTMGDDVQLEGVETGGLTYEMGETENPEDALANRLNAVFSILGGSGPVGVEPQFDDGLYNELTAVGDPSAGISDVAGATAAGVLSGDKGGLQKYAMSKLAQYGWSSNEMAALIELWTRESGWNPAADNPTSSAAGIAQKMTSIHGPLEPTPQGQIDWGLEYILDRYGSPSKALAFHNQNNWY